MFASVKSSGNMLIQMGSSGVVNFTASRPNKNVFSATAASGTLIAYANGASKGSDTSIANPSSNDLKDAGIGYSDTAGLSNFDFYGHSVIYGFVDSTANRARIEKWFAERMGLVY